MPNRRKRKRTRAGANRRARPHGSARHGPGDGPPCNGPAAAAAGTEAGITPGPGTIAALDGWDQPHLIAALDANGTTWILGAADPQTAEQTAAQLPGTRVGIRRAGEHDPAVTRTRILTPAETARIRALITQQLRQQQAGQDGTGTGTGQEPGTG